MGLPPIVIEREVLAGIAAVWRAWTEPSELARWLAVRANVLAEPGGPYELFWDPARPAENSTLGCLVTQVVPYERLEFSWRGPVPFADIMNTEPPPTRVRVLFEAMGPNRTRVRLEHHGWGEGPKWEEARHWQFDAWQIAIGRLPQQLEA